MSDRLPPYYFRLRENGATMCRVRFDNRLKRIEFDELASINLKKGVVRPLGDHSLSPADQAALESWCETRRRQLRARTAESATTTIEALNHTTHWAQSRATAAELAHSSDMLLLAMHDLRMVLLRKKAERLSAELAFKDA